MKKFLVFLVVGFIIIYGIVSLSKGNGSSGKTSNSNINRQPINNQQTINYQQPNAKPKTQQGNSSAYYAALVSQYDYKVKQDMKHVDNCQDSYDFALKNGTGYITAQMSLNAAQELLSTDEQMLENYRSKYNEALAQGR